MAKNIKGLTKLRKALEKVQKIAGEVQDNLDEKQAWWDCKTANWQEGDDGEEWAFHMSSVQDLLDGIEDLPTEEAFENLQEPDIKVNPKQ